MSADTGDQERLAKHVAVGKAHRHYKGDYYLALEVGPYTGSNKEVEGTWYVKYLALYLSVHGNKPCFREVGGWLSMVENPKQPGTYVQRYEPLSDEDAKAIACNIRGYAGGSCRKD